MMKIYEVSNIKKNALKAALRHFLASKTYTRAYLTVNKTDKRDLLKILLQYRRITIEMLGTCLF